MALYVPNAAENLICDLITNKGSGQNLVLKLFCNNYTPVAASVAGDFTEAAGGGYTAKTLTGASWASASTNGSGQAESAYAAQTFTFTGSLTTNTTVYGYFLVQASSGTIVAAEKLASSFTPSQNGDALTITPKMQVQSIN